MSKLDLESLKYAETKFITTNYLAFRIVDSPSLKELFQTGLELGAKYGNVDLDEFWFGRKGVTDNLGNIVNCFKTKIKAQIEIAKLTSSLSVCTDIWSDKYRHNSYLDVTLVLIDNEFKMRHYAIGFRHFPQAHTGDNIRDKLNQILDEYDLNSASIPIVTDSARNMIKAFKHTTWLPCFAHRLNTCVQDSFKSVRESDAEINTLYQNMKDIRSFINQSSDKSDILSKKIPIGNLTRPWSALFYFFSAFCQSYSEIEEIANSKNLIMPTNKPLIQMLLNIFEKFEPFFKKLQIINTPSLHFVLLEVIRLKNNLLKPVSLGGQPARMANFVKIILETIKNKYFKQISTNHIISLFMHPNYKNSITKFAVFLDSELEISYELIYEAIQNMTIVNTNEPEYVQEVTGEST